MKTYDSHKKTEADARSEVAATGEAITLHFPGGSTLIVARNDDPCIDEYRLQSATVVVDGSGTVTSSQLCGPLDTELAGSISR